MSAEAWRRSRTDVAPRSFAWQAWHFRHLRLDLRGRRGTFATYFHRCPRKLGDELGRIDAAAFYDVRMYVCR